MWKIKVLLIPVLYVSRFFAVNSEANARRIAMVESCFGTSGQTLNEPGRVLVGEGVLTKMCRKKPKSRQFFLFNDILVYGNIVLNKKKVRSCYDIFVWLLFTVFDFMLLLVLEKRVQY